MNLRLSLFAVFVTGLTATLFTPSLRADFTASSDFDYSTGKYGEKITTNMYISNVALEYAQDRWSGRMIVPYYIISGPGDVLPRVGRVNGVRRLILDQSTRTDRGLGDVVLSGSYDVLGQNDDNWFVSFTGDIKLATADEKKGLGTGKRDYSPRVDVSRSLGDFTPYVSLGYRFVGKPNGSNLRDYPYGSIGLNYAATELTTLGVAFDCNARTSDTANVDNELSASVSHTFAPGWRLSLRALAGLSSSAPDFGAGGSLSYTF